MEQYKYFNVNGKRTKFEFEDFLEEKSDDPNWDKKLIWRYHEVNNPDNKIDLFTYERKPQRQ